MSIYEEIHPNHFGNISISCVSDLKEEGSGLFAAAMFKVGRFVCKWLWFAQAQAKYATLRRVKKEEEEAALMNNKAMSSLYGTAHILKMEVINQADNPDVILFCFCKGGEDQGGGGGGWEELSGGEAGEAKCVRMVLALCLYCQEEEPTEPSLYTEEEMEEMLDI